MPKKKARGSGHTTKNKRKRADEQPKPSPSSRPKRRRSAPDTAVADRAGAAPDEGQAPCCQPKLTQVEQRIMIKGYYVQVLK